jgi:hypothetical protein
MRVADCEGGDRGGANFQAQEQIERHAEVICEKEIYTGTFDFSKPTFEVTG